MMDASLLKSGDFFVNYTAKDLMAYALALGFGNSEGNAENELRYTYEHREDFCAVPTFALVLPFWASRPPASCAEIRTFPPQMMRSMGIVPKQLLRDDNALNNVNVLHTAQSVIWHCPLPTPEISRHSPSGMAGSSVSVLLNGRFLSVIPKRIGTFVTTETTVYERVPGSSYGTAICTLRSTSLIHGLSKEMVIPYGVQETTPRLRQAKFSGRRNPDFAVSLKTPLNGALLYRVASGDFNEIHVDPSVASMLGGDGSRPVLHGLCTLGIVTRAVLQYLSKERCKLDKLSCQFIGPVFVGDSLRVRLWREASRTTLPSETGEILFEVNTNSESAVMHGSVAIISTKTDVNRLSQTLTKSKL